MMPFGLTIAVAQCFLSYPKRLIPVKDCLPSRLVENDQIQRIIDAIISSYGSDKKLIPPTKATLEAIVFDKLLSSPSLEPYQADFQEHINTIYSGLINPDTMLLAEALKYIKNVILDSALQESSRRLNTADNGPEVQLLISNRLTRVAEVVTGISSTSETFEPLSLKHNMIDSILRQVNGHDQNVAVCPSGFDSIDQSLSRGGYAAGQLIVVAAGPKRGKSLFLLNSALNMAYLGKSVAFVTLEMTLEEQYMRAASMLSCLSYKEIIKDIPSATKLLTEKLGGVSGDVTFYYFPYLTMTALSLKQVICSDKKYDIIVIDYGNLVKPLIAYNEKKDRIAESFYNLKSWAAEVQTPILTASQLNRIGTLSGSPTSEDSGESYEIPRVADAYFIISQTQTERQGGILRLHLVSQRHGQEGIVLPFSVNYEKSLRFQHLDSSRLEMSPLTIKQSGMPVMDTYTAKNSTKAKKKTSRKGVSG